jgi:sterol 14-demethylase
MAFNASSFAAPEAWSGFVEEAQKYLPQTTSRIALLAFVNIPLIAIILNVLRQLVRFTLRYFTPCF